MTTEKEVTLNAHNKVEYPPMHTCEHILNQTMVRMFGCERSRNAHIERKKSKINYDLADEPTEEQIAEIARKVNEVIAADLPVTYAYVSRDAVPDNVPLDKLPDAAEDTLRLVRVGDYDVCACIGAHVNIRHRLAGSISTARVTRTDNSGLCSNCWIRFGNSFADGQT